MYVHLCSWEPHTLTGPLWGGLGAVAPTGSKFQRRCSRDSSGRAGAQRRRKPVVFLKTSFRVAAEGLPAFFRI